MAKRGPGRPFKPKLGPKIDPKSAIELPHDVFENEIIKEILTFDEFEAFQSIPQHLRDNYIGTLKKSIFALRGKNTPQGNILANYGEREYSDLAGVQVSLSLDPQDWQKPDYLKKTVINWMKGVANSNDIERETEKKVIRRILQGGNGSKALGSVKLVEDSLRTLPNGTQTVLRGGAGLNNKAMYKEFSDNMFGFIDVSQSIGDRAPVLGALRQSYFENLAREVYHNTPRASTQNADPGFIQSTDESTLSVDDFNAKKAREVLAISSDLEARINALPAGPQKDALKKLFIDSAGSPAVNGKFTKAFLTGKNGITYNLENVVSLQTVGGSVRAGSYIDFNKSNSFAKSQFLTRFGTFDPTASVYWSDVSKFLQNNYAEFGFSSRQAVDDLFKNANGKNLQDAITKKLDLALFRIDKPGGILGGPGIGSATIEDVYKFREVYRNINDAIEDARGALIEEQIAKIAANPSKFTDAILDLIPNADRGGIESMTKILRYAEIRSKSLALEEFVDAVKRKNIIKVYFVLGKYNNLLPKDVQNLKKKIDTLKIPLGKGKYRTVGDFMSHLEYIKNEVAYKAGLQGYEGHMAYHTLKGNNPLLAFSLKTTYLYDADFIAQTQYVSKLGIRGSGKAMKLDLFSNRRTFTNLGIQNQQFSNGHLFKNLKPGVMRLVANDFDGLQDVWQAVDSMAAVLRDAVGTNLQDLNALHGIFENAYDVWNTTGRFDFLVNPAIMPKNLTPADIARYEAAFGKIFSKLKKLSISSGLDKSEFFSFIVTVSDQKKFIDFSNMQRITLQRYVPILTNIADQLSAVQTYALNYLDSKVLQRTLFKVVPGTQKLYDKWFRPGVGAFDTTEEVAKLLSKFAQNTGLKAMWARFMSGTSGKLLQALSARLLPGFLTATSLASAGMTYLMYAISKIGGNFIGGLWKTLRGDYKALYYAFLNTMNDLIVVPSLFVIRILKIVGVIIFVFVLLIFINIILFIGGGLLNNSQRPIKADIITDEYGNRLTGVYVGGKYCIALAADTVGGDFKSKMNGDPFDTSYYHSITQCIADTYTSRFHTGLDIGMVIGTPLLSPYSGQAEVVEATSGGGYNGGYGNTVVLKIQADGKIYYLRYEHMSTVDVSVGDVVNKGDKVGTSGSTGNSGGPHLHFEMSLGSTTGFLNPCEFLSCSSYGGLSCNSSNLGASLCPK